MNYSIKVSGCFIASQFTSGAKPPIVITGGLPDGCKLVDAKFHWQIEVVELIFSDGKEMAALELTPIVHTK